MSWKTIRLELAQTRDYPNGSPVRAYLLRLPLNDRGGIDVDEFRASPINATVRRYWPNEPDRTGHLIHSLPGWKFAYREGKGDGEADFVPGSGPIRLDRCLTVIERGGPCLPFRVVRCEG